MKIIFLFLVFSLSQFFCAAASEPQLFNRDVSFQGALTEGEYDGFIIDFKNDATKEDLQAFRDSFGLEYIKAPEFADTEKFAYVKKKIADIKGWFSKLLGSFVVEGVEKNYILSLYENGDGVKASFRDPKAADFPKDPLYKYQWHMAQIGVPKAAAFATGRGAVVAVIDTGVAFENHKPFALARDLNNTRFVKPYNFLANNVHANDDHGHGTHVAGTIAQSTHNGLGVIGVAPDAAIMPLKVLDRSGRGDILAIARAIKYAADNGAHIINMSLGGPFPSSVLRKACRYARDKGVLLVCAAGNSGGSVGYPAAYPECMAVSAVQYDETMTFYSSHGRQVEIAAPGGNTKVDQNKDGYPDGVLQNTVHPDDPGKDDYFLFMGTSMAAPHVAGAAALLHSVGITNGEKMRKMLKDTARPKGEPQKYGSGLLDIGAAVSSILFGTGYHRLIAALFFALLFFKGSRLRMLKPGFILGVVIFSAGFFPLYYFITADSAVAIFLRPLPEWDLWLSTFKASPIFRSAFFGLLLVGFFFQLKSFRPFIQGACFGLAGYLFYAAMFADLPLGYIPSWLCLDSLWYIGNAVAAVTLGSWASVDHD
jgi:serine protease